MNIAISNLSQYRKTIRKISVITSATYTVASKSLSYRDSKYNYPTTKRMIILEV